MHMQTSVCQTNTHKNKRKNYEDSKISSNFGHDGHSDNINTHRVCDGGNDDEFAKTSGRAAGC